MAQADAGLDTLAKLVLHNGSLRGDQPALREKSRGIWRTMSWRNFADEAATLAASLQARGLKRGAHVALIGDNRPRLYMAMCAAQWLGAVAVPLYQDASADEVAGALRSAEVTHVFAENQEQVDKILSILPHCPSIQCIVYDKDRGMRHYRQPQLVSYAELLEDGRKRVAGNRAAIDAEAARGSGQDAAFLFFTSGTTGPAKGVVFTYAPLIDRARAIATAEGITAADVAMAYLPPGWIGQNLFAYVVPLTVGCCVCCPESSETMLADMREMGPTVFLATPRVLEAIVTQVTIRLEDTGGFNKLLYERGLEAGRRIEAQRLAGKPVSLSDRIVFSACRFMIYGPLRDVLGMSRLRVAYTAGDAVTPDLLTYFHTLGVNLKQLYGSTESGFFVSIPRTGDVKPDSAGVAIEGVEIRFTPQREILVRSPGLFKEYHRDPAATARARDQEGWLRTGDAGYLGDDGQLRIIDRIDYVGALTDGSPFAPRLLESRLKFFSYIKEAVVIGGGRPMACALIDIDPVAVGRWADKRAISYTGHADLASREEVYGLIGDCIAKINAALAHDPMLAKSQIKRFAILQKELSADDGLLTRTGKLRRENVAEHYHALIDAIYSGKPELRVGAQSGSASAESFDIKIRDVRPAESERVGRAA